MLNNNRGFNLSLCLQIHIKGTLHLQGNFTFKNNCASLVQLLSVYVSLLMAVHPIFTLEFQAYTVQRMFSPRTSVSVIKCKMLCSEWLQKLNEAEHCRKRKKVSKKMSCKNYFQSYLPSAWKVTLLSTSSDLVRNCMLLFSGCFDIFGLRLKEHRAVRLHLGSVVVLRKI